MVSVLPIILAIGLNLIIDAVKTVLKVTGRELLWEKYSPLVPKLTALIGFITGIIVAVVYDANLIEFLNTLGFSTVGGLAATGIDNAFKTQDEESDRVFFNSVELPK